jgi:hypothetical protein
MSRSSHAVGDVPQLLDALVERDCDIANSTIRSHVEHVMFEIDLVPRGSQRTAACG